MLSTGPFAVQANALCGVGPESFTGQLGSFPTALSDSSSAECHGRRGWRQAGSFVRINRMPTNLSIQTLIGDVVGSTGHRYAMKDSAGNKMDTVKIIAQSGRWLPRYLSHRRQHQSRDQSRPAELGLSAHPGPAGNSTHHLRVAGNPRSSRPCSSRPRAPRPARPASWCTTANTSPCPPRHRAVRDLLRQPGLHRFHPGPHRPADRLRLRHRTAVGQPGRRPVRRPVGRAGARRPHRDVHVLHPDRRRGPAVGERRPAGERLDRPRRRGEPRSR